MDCVEVCPVDWFYEGENMLIIHPNECIDCGHGLSADQKIKGLHENDFIMATKIDRIFGRTATA
jgi:ferredoxin